MSSTKLHYVFDPLCGWCYGASPLVQEARGLLPVQAHAGGMLLGTRRRPVTAELRKQVVVHDRRIAELSGQPFGPAYVDGLLNDPTAVLDSGPPITAVLAADHLAGVGLDMLARLQAAHYVEGRRIAEFVVIRDLAAGLGLDPQAFAVAFQALEGHNTQAHIDQSRAMLVRMGGRGFPSFALERAGRLIPVDFGPYLGQPRAWRNWLSQQLVDNTPLSAQDSGPPPGRMTPPEPADDTAD